MTEWEAYVAKTEREHTIIAGVWALVFLVFGIWGLILILGSLM